MPKTSKVKRRWYLLPVFLFVGAMGLWGMLKVASVQTTAQYSDWEASHPFFAMVGKVIDGDTFIIDDGRTVRLIGIDAPDRGMKGYESSLSVLKKMIEGKAVWLEYDRTEDKYGRLLAWVWIECEGKPEFLPYDYMYLSQNASKPGLMENPIGCKEGRLVNESMRRKGMAKSEFYKDRGELKYQARLGK